MSVSVRPALPPGLTAIVEDVLALCDDREVRVGALVTGFGRAGLLPLILLPALIVASPLSAIPLLSTVNGLIIGLAALQLAAGRKCLWLPGMLANRSISTRRLKAGVRRMRPAAQWLDGRTRTRLSILARPPFSSLVALICAGCGLAMPFLELVPMSSSLLALTAMLLALGLLVRDGLLILLAPIPLTAALWIIVTII